MKQLIQVSTCPFKHSNKFGKFYYDGNNLSNDNEYLLFIEGFITTEDFDVNCLIANYKTKGVDYLNSLEGNYNIVIVSENVLVASTDRFAFREMLYYSDGNKFVLSNKFWNMLDIIQPTYEMLDLDQVCAYGVYGHYLFKKTLLKNLDIQHAGTNISFDAITNNVEEKAYCNLYEDFVEDDISLDEAADRFQESLLQFRDYVNKNYSDKKIGVSVSGGLDSRILPALFGKDVQYFLIAGANKSGKFGVRPYNLNYLDKIAKAYGINLKIVDTADTMVSDRVNIEMTNFPLGNNNFIKTIDMKSSGLDFELLINAGAPDLLSSTRTMVRKGWDFFDIMEKYEGNRYLLVHGKKTNYLKKLKKIVIDRMNTFDIYSTLTYIDFYPIKIEEKESFYTRIHKYISDGYQLGKNPNAILHYRYNSAGAFCGAFESLTGQCEAISFFHPFVNNILKNLPFRYIQNRLVLKRVIEKYYPEVYNIESEHSIMGIHDEAKASLWPILKALFRLKIGGISGIAVSAEQVKEFVSLYDQKSEWFESVFDDKKIRATYKSNLSVFLSYLKLKLIIGIIERKEWSKYC